MDALQNPDKWDPTEDQGSQAERDFTVRAFIELLFSARLGTNVDPNNIVRAYPLPKMIGAIKVTHLGGAVSSKRSLRSNLMRAFRKYQMD